MCWRPVFFFFHVTRLLVLAPAVLIEPRHTGPNHILIIFPQVNVDESYVTVQAGISLHALHVHLATHGLAMSNVGSISDQSLGGIVTTATHGSGVDYAVIPGHVLSMTLLVADGSYVRCSRHEREDLFLATLSGLGTTGIVLTVQLSVEPEFRLREVQEMIDFDAGIERFDDIARSAEHVRIWWFPRQRAWRVMAASRTKEVGSWFYFQLAKLNCHAGA